MYRTDEGGVFPDTLGYSDPLSQLSYVGPLSLRERVVLYTWEQIEYQVVCGLDYCMGTWNNVRYNQLDAFCDQRHCMDEDVGFSADDSMPGN